MNFFVNKAMGIGNSGVEHAQFYRAKCFESEEIPYKYVFTECIKNLHEAMEVWGLLESRVINMWELFVLGSEYLESGIKTKQSFQEDIVIDYTNTHREKRIITSSGLLIIEHMEKSPSKKQEHLLMVSNYKVEIYHYKTMKRKVIYEMKDHSRRGRIMQNIHLFDFEDQHLFFHNEVQLQQYFFAYLVHFFDGTHNFIIDRGQESEAALFSRKLEGVKIIEIIHADHLSDRDEPSAPLWNNHYEYLFRNMDKVVVATKLQRKDLLLDFPQEANKIVIIPVGGIRDQKRDPLLKESPKKMTGKFITVSRLAKEKHLDIVVQAIVQARNEFPHVSLDIYGQGSERAYLEQLIKKMEAEDYITLKGLSRNLEAIYSQYEAFISGSYSEGFGLTYVEALNVSLPIVTFNARFGALELVKDHQTGFLKDFSRTDEKYSIEQLTQGIKQLTEGDISSFQMYTRTSIKEFQDSVISSKWRRLINELRVK